MVNFASGQRRIVFKTNRETLMLVAGACAATVALAVTIHARPPEAPVVETAQPQQDWTGHLADVSSEQVGMMQPEPMTSASLVVPKADLALPTAAVRPKARPCDASSASCKPRAKAIKPATVRVEEVRDESLLDRLNPLNHLPDIATLGRPFSYAGTKISGWFDRL